MNAIELANFIKKGKSLFISTKDSIYTQNNVFCLFFPYDRNRWFENMPKIKKIDFLYYIKIPTCIDWYRKLMQNEVSYLSFQIIDNDMTFEMTSSGCRFLIYIDLKEFTFFYFNHYYKIKDELQNKINQLLSENLFKKLKNLGLNKKVRKHDYTDSCYGKFSINQLRENYVEYFNLITKNNQKS